MKKRNEEGFALVYVAIVIVILCTIATAIMSYNLRNLQAQEAMVQRMEDKYEAMGEIERVVAEIETIPQWKHSRTRWKGRAVSAARCIWKAKA